MVPCGHHGWELLYVRFTQVTKTEPKYFSNKTSVFIFYDVYIEYFNGEFNTVYEWRLLVIVLLILCLSSLFSEEGDVIDK